MKKRLLALALALSCVLAMIVPAYAVFSPEEQLEILHETETLIRQYVFDSSSKDDPLGRVLPDHPTDEALLLRLTEDPTLYESLMMQMLSAYDSHTMYLPAGTYGGAFYSTDDYVGIGVSIVPDVEGVRVTSLHPAGSAARAGMQWGDVITDVEGLSLAGLTSTAAVQRMQGEAGTFAALSVLREGEPLSFRLERTRLTTVSYFGAQLEKNIFYMKLSAFATDDGSYELFQKDLKQLGKNDCLILDLRDNPGGDMDLACSMISDLLPDRQPYFRTAVRNPDTDLPTYTYLTSDGTGKQLRAIYILTNGNSASASEIMTASLVDAGVAQSVGESTYGKARGQYHIVLDDDSALVVTVIQLLSLAQGDYEEIGLAPTHIAHDYMAPTPYRIELPAQVPLAPYSCSDNGELLNRALVAIGYLPQMPEKPYQVGDETMAALRRLEAELEFPAEQCSEGASVSVLAAIQLLLAYMGQGMAHHDVALSQAIELCHETLSAKKAA